MTDAEINGHGLCYRDRRTDGYAALSYSGDKEYDLIEKDLDSYKCVFFFGKSERVSIESGQHTTNVHLIVIAKLDSISTTSALMHRGDNEARLDVYRFVNSHGGMTELIDEVTGLETVFSDYPAMLKGNFGTLGDTYPYHSFRCNIRVVYKPSSIYRNNI